MGELLQLIVFCAILMGVIMFFMVASDWWHHIKSQRRQTVGLTQYSETICMMCGHPDNWASGLPKTPGYYWFCHSPEEAWDDNEDFRPYLVKVFKPVGFWSRKPKKYLKYCTIDSTNTSKLSELGADYTWYCGPLGPPPAAEFFPRA
jgi:hypothetical protein